MILSENVTTILQMISIILTTIGILIICIRQIIAWIQGDVNKVERLELKKQTEIEKLKDEQQKLITKIQANQSKIEKLEKKE